MPWYYGTIIGAFSLAILNSLTRVLPITFKSWLIIAIPLLACNLGFWYGFKHSPQFVGCWFLGTALTAVLALPLGIFIFDKGFSLATAAGIAMVLFGAYLLVK